MRILHVLNHSLPVQDGYAMRTAAILRGQAARGWQTLQVTSDRHESAVEAEQVGDLHFLRTRKPPGWLEQSGRNRGRGRGRQGGGEVGTDLAF